MRTISVRWPRPAPSRNQHGEQRASRRDGCDRDIRYRHGNLGIRFRPIDIGIDRLAIKPAHMPAREILALIERCDGQGCQHFGLLHVRLTHGRMEGGQMYQRGEINFCRKFRDAIDAAPFELSVLQAFEDRTDALRRRDRRNEWRRRQMGAATIWLGDAGGQWGGSRIEKRIK